MNTEAAGLVGLTVNEFLVERALGDALSIVDAHHSIRLQADAYERFLVALDGPPLPADGLVDQIRASQPFEAC